MAEDKQKPVAVKNRFLRITAIVITLLVIAAVILGMSRFRKSANPIDNHAAYKVQKGPLIISVIESGTIKARDQVILKNEVEGRTSIITLVPEGTLVRKGDLLVELDASALIDQKIDQEIRVQNQEASYIGSKENFAVVENQAKSDVDKAKLDYEFAKQDLKKYLEGEYPNQLQEAQAKITLAEEELTRARETLKWSRTLSEEKFISNTELQADELAEKKRALDLELAKNNLDLLQNFTYQRKLAQLESDVSQAEMALERTIRKANANVVQAEADLRAKEAEYRRQQDRLQKLTDQISKTKIYAPVDGLVIYATSAQRGGWRGGTEPLREGQQVLERQELIYLPTAESAKAEVDIHEASLQKISLGMRAIITVNALQGQKFFGTISKIAPLPDAQSMWLNPDLKVYNTDINIDGNPENLRTGMSCRAEIIVEQYEEALSIPVQAVIRVEGEPTVYVVSGNTLEPRRVEMGLDNNRMVRIISGLREGEIVSLTPPLKAAAIERTTVIIPEAAVSGEKTPDIPQEQPKAEQADVAPMPVFDPAKMREAFENMSDEDKEKIRQHFENMSPEEREQMRKQFESMQSPDRARTTGQGRRGQGGRGTPND